MLRILVTLAVSFVSFHVLSGTVEAQRSASSRELTYPRRGAVLGQGWNSEEETPVLVDCLDYESQEPRTTQRSWIELQHVIDSESVARRLNVSAGMSADLWLGSVGGNVNFSNAVRSSATETNFLVRATVENAEHSIGLATAQDDGVDAVRIKPALLREFDLATPEGVADFHSKCGDSFVEVLYTGASFSGMISLREESFTKRTELATSLSGSYGGSISFDVNVESELQEYENNNRFRASALQEGGYGGTIGELTFEGMKRSASALPEVAKNNPWAMRVVVTRYESLANWPDADPSAWTRDPLRVLMRRALRLDHVFYEVSRVRDIHFRKDTTAGYITTNEDIDCVYDELIDVRKEVAGRVAQCREGGSCDEPEGIRFDDYYYRVWLPVHKLSFAGGVKMRDAQNQVYYARLHNASPDELSEAEARYEALQEGYAGHVRAAMVEQWVSDASEFRCRVPTDPGCLKNEYIQNLYGTMLVNGPRPYDRNNRRCNRARRR